MLCWLLGHGHDMVCRQGDGVAGGDLTSEPSLWLEVGVRAAASQDARF